VPLRPRAGAVLVEDVVAQQQLGQPLPGAHQIAAHVLPRAHEVPATLRELRRLLPSEVVVVEPRHPLAGRTLAVDGCRTVGGERCLLVRLPDGSAGTVALSATSAGERPTGGPGGALLSPGGVRRLRALLKAREGDPGSA
jgi:hypothetical protein